VFDAIGDMPLHPLVVHAVVIGIPLTLLMAVLFAVPRFRSWARWALGVVAVGSAVVTMIARASGPSLAQALGIVPGNPVGDLISRHAQLATQLTWIMVVVAVLAVLNVLLVSRGREQKTVERVLPLVLIVAALIAAIWVVRTGDIGSRAAWNPTGSINYSSGG
jgi:formate hydrogenlyase subunit 3/multisubunit Na+/H+ antiporter MnhD subunit